MQNAYEMQFLGEAKENSTGFLRAHLVTQAVFFKRRRSRVSFVRLEKYLGKTRNAYDQKHKAKLRNKSNKLKLMQK